MNNTRRKKLAAILEEIEILRAQVEEITEEEQDAFDNMPESIQYSEKGERMESIISNLEEIVSGLEDIEDGLNNYEDV